LAVRAHQPITLLFENERCMVFDKPAGIPVIPTPAREKWTLTAIVNEEYAPADKSWQLHPCHRLDQETSGCILFAKGKSNQQLLMRLFWGQRIRKHYTALVHGRMDRMAGTISSSVESFESHKYKNRDKRPAVTKYRVLVRKKNFSIVDVEPVTGRSNQIRIQFKQIGHPLVGERKYAFAKDYALKFRRTALHARSLQWADPVEHKKIIVESPLPKDIQEFIETHR
jgi:23S rRNA pseudouridine1911/1915/1917 synthase